MRRGLALLLFMLAAAATAQDIKYEKYTLPNGMVVILHEDHRLPVATVNIWYHVGSKDEPPGRSGFAHLFEHLMFMGTKRAPAGMFDQIMESGGGTNNASTTQDRTNYYDYGPSALLPTLLWLEADRMEDLGRMMDQHKLNLQREVVLNERRQNYENAPYGMAPIAIDKVMYPEGHPYHIDTIGLVKDLNAATVQDVKDFFATYYVPNNASMVVAGDFDPVVVKPLIARLFGTLPRRNDPIHQSAPEPTLDQVKRLTLVDKVPQARTIMVWHSPAYYKPGDAEMDLAAGVLSDGVASRLYKRLVVDDELASEVSASQDSQYLSSLFTIDATARPGVSLEKVEAAIDDELARFVKDGPAEDELERDKAKWRYSSLASVQDLSEVADRMNQYEFYLGEPNSFAFDLERHTKATRESVLAWAAKVLDPNARLVLRIVPESPSPAQNPRDARPRIAPEKAFSLPSPMKATLANGVKLFYFQRPELPLMDVSILFNAGSASDPVGKAGLASMAADMLDEGAGALDAEAFNKALDALGAVYTTSTGVLTSTANLSVSADHFAKALPLVADSLVRYRLDPEVLDREKSLRIDELAQAAEDPETLARLVALREFFGDSNPYGLNPLGTSRTIKSLTLDDVRAAHQAIFRPDQMTIFAAGSLPLGQVTAQLDAAFAQWQPTGPRAQNRAPLTPVANGLKVVIVDKPGAVQTVIRFMFPGVPYASPNRLALRGIATVLGGTFTSRLNANLRESKGYTYGAGAHAVFEPALGYMTAESPVRADVTGLSLKEFFAEFARIRTGDISEAEAGKARTSLRTDTIGSMETLGGLVGTAESLYEVGASMDDLSRELDRLSKLTAVSLNPLAKNGLPLDRGVLVLVGDKSLILKQIASLKLPKPQIVTVAE